MKKLLLATAALALVGVVSGAAYAQSKATPGKSIDMVLLPKFLGIAVFFRLLKFYAGFSSAA